MEMKNIPVFNLETKRICVRRRPPRTLLEKTGRSPSLMLPAWALLAFSLGIRGQRQGGHITLSTQQSGFCAAEEQEEGFVTRA